MHCASSRQGAGRSRQPRVRTKSVSLHARLQRFFFTVGVALVGAALIYFSADSAVGNLIAAALIWMLAELLVRRMRLVLPGILLACFFVFLIFQAADAGWNQYVGYPPQLVRMTLRGLLLQNATPAALLVKFGAVAAAASLFYWRFRLPFTLLLIAGSLVAAATIAAGLVQLRRCDVRRGGCLFVCGLLVFAQRWPTTSPTRHV